MINVQQDAAALDVARWDSLEPHYAALSVAGEVDDAWLARWSSLAEQVAEGASWLSIRYSQDTTDAVAEEAWFSYLREVAPRLHAAEQTLKERWVNSARDVDNGLHTVRRQFESDVALFREENLLLEAQERTRSTRYSQLIGGLTVAFDGADRTMAEMGKYAGSPDRAVRKAAWHAEIEGRGSLREELNDLFDELLALRVQIAANAGFENFRDYAWQRLGRFDYSPGDAEAFREAIFEVVVPALGRQMERRAQDLEVENLRPWDTRVDPLGADALMPFSSGDELAGASERIFTRVDSELGGYIRRMREDQLLDLENRKGKAPGGYCASLSAKRLPFIFMNAVGTDDNVRTMLHEAGHAFHVFESGELPHVWQRRSPMEFAEVASMSMELLGAPYLELDEGGFYEPRQALRSRIQHLERIVSFLPYMATVDAFQHWLYANPDHDHVARDQAWYDLHQRFCVGVDWSGIENIRASLWQHKLHIFSYPFYYIEYGIAQLGALQVWRNSHRDPVAALSAYRKALSLGGTRTLPELFTAADICLTFDAQDIAKLVVLIEENVEELRDRLAAVG